jgi:deoxyribose-phosphate aldolase
MNIAGYIQHALLSPATTIADADQCCAEALQYGFASVCVPPLFVKRAKGLLAGSNVQLATVTGFPLGYSVIEAKLAEIVMAMVDGADELDMVINTTAVKNHDWQYLAKEIGTILPIVKGKGKAMNIIVEAGSFTKEELVTCCDIYGAAGVDAVITGTAYAEKALTVEMVQLLRTHLASAVKITAAGDIKNYSFARQLIDAGASRLSCTNGMVLVQEMARQN